MGTIYIMLFLKLYLCMVLTGSACVHASSWTMGTLSQGGSVPVKEAVKKLVEHTRRAQQPVEPERPPVNRACPTHPRCTNAHVAAQRKHPRACLREFLRDGINLKAPYRPDEHDLQRPRELDILCNNHTALWIAAHYGSVQCAKMLIDEWEKEVEDDEEDEDLRDQMIEDFQDSLAEAFKQDNYCVPLLDRVSGGALYNALGAPKRYDADNDSDGFFFRQRLIISRNHSSL